MYQKIITQTPPIEYKAGSHNAFTSANIKAQTTELLEGTVMAFNTVDEVYEPYAAAGVNGLNVPKYILDERIALDSNATPEIIPAKVLYHGRVKDSQITCNGTFGGADGTTKTALPLILFDTEE